MTIGTKTTRIKRNIRIWLRAARGAHIAELTAAFADECGSPEQAFEYIKQMIDDRALGLDGENLYVKKAPKWGL